MSERDNKHPARPHQSQPTTDSHPQDLPQDNGTADQNPAENPEVDRLPELTTLPTRGDTPEARAGADADAPLIPTGDWDKAGTTKAPNSPGSVTSPDTARMPKIPGYQILRELGRGGMGVVYEAKHLQLDRIVALKMILVGSHAGERELTRFRIEAEAVARLQHSGIVQICDVGEHEGLPYFSLEFCSGGSLEDRLNGAPQNPKGTARLVEQLARAMQVAHESNVIHRDLKPANVLLTEDGTPKITDFGLAKKLDEVGQTQTGAIMGTPSYMAPEQASQRKVPIGPAADVYAMGAILYECLTGRPPFRASTGMETILQVLSDEPVAPRRLNPKTPNDLETICLKCLHKEPHERYLSAEELADDLQRYQNGEPIKARPVGSLERLGKWVRRRPALAGFLTTTLLLSVMLPLGVIAYLQKQESLLQKQRAEQLQGVAEKNSQEANRLRGIAEKAQQALAQEKLKSDVIAYGNQMNYALQLWKEGDTEAAWSTLLQTQQKFRGWEHGYLTRLFNPATLKGHNGSVSSVAFSPDGSRIVSGSWDKTIKVWDTVTGQELLTLKGHIEPVRSVAFSSDGSRIVSGSGCVLRFSQCRVDSEAYLPENQAFLL